MTILLVSFPVEKYHDESIIKLYLLFYNTALLIIKQ